MSTKQIEDEVKGLVEEAEQMRGLGDVVAKVTKKLGIKECAPCAERRRKLNEAVPFKKEPKK